MRIHLDTKSINHSVVLVGGVVATHVLQGIACDNTDHLLLTNFNV